jgi:hypothetical protein
VRHCDRNCDEPQRIRSGPTVDARELCAPLAVPTHVSRTCRRRGPAVLDRVSARGPAASVRAQSRKIGTRDRGAQAMLSSPKAAR